MLVIEAHRSTIGKIYDTTTSLLPIHSFKMNSKGAYFQKRVTSSKKLQITSYYHFRKILLFTWVTVFILLHVQQWQTDLKVSGHVESNPEPIWGHFTKAIEGFVTLLVSNVLVISCMHYVGQKLKRFLYRMVPILNIV